MKPKERKANVDDETLRFHEWSPGDSSPPSFFVKKKGEKKLRKERSLYNLATARPSSFFFYLFFVSFLIVSRTDVHSISRHCSSGIFFSSRFYSYRFLPRTPLNETRKSEKRRWISTKKKGEISQKLRLLGCTFYVTF